MRSRVLRRASLVPLAVVLVTGLSLYVVHIVQARCRQTFEPLGIFWPQLYSTNGELEPAQNGSIGDVMKHLEDLNDLQLESRHHDVTEGRDAQTSRTKPTVAIVSSCVASDKFSDELIQLSQLNKQQYCDAHEDVFCYLYNVSMDARFNSKWNKYPLVAHALKFHDYVVWTDCDSVFVNITLTFDEIGLFRVKKDLVLTFDHNGINTGVFVVKRSDWSRAFLSLMYAQRVSVDYFNAKGKGSGFVDQQGLDILRDKLFSKEEFDSHTDVSARFTKFLNNYCSTGGLIHHRVDCNSEECDGHLVCIVQHLRSGNATLDGAACPAPEQMQSLCREQTECCQDV